MCSTDCPSGCECGEFSTGFRAAFNVITDITLACCNMVCWLLIVKQAVWEAATICPRRLWPVTLTFDLLTLKVVSESRMTWATSLPILVFVGLSVLDLGPMYAKDRQTSDSLGAGHNKWWRYCGWWWLKLVESWEIVSTLRFDPTRPEYDPTRISQYGILPVKYNLFL